MWSKTEELNHNSAFLQDFNGLHKQVHSFELYIEDDIIVTINWTIIELAK